jgi:hypothetical protein
VRLTTSLLVGAKYFGCVVCRFRVAASAELRPDRCHKQIVWSVAKPGSINLQKWFLSPTGSIKPWFHTKGNLPLCSSYLSLGVPNWVASTANQPPLPPAKFWPTITRTPRFPSSVASLPIPPPVHGLIWANLAQIPAKDSEPKIFREMTPTNQDSEYQKIQRKNSRKS